MSSSYTCVCKRIFTAQNYFSQHQRLSVHTKKRLSSAISSFREFVGHKKAHTSPGLLGADGLPREASNALPIDLSSGDVNTSTATQYCKAEVAPARPPSSGGGIVSPDCEVGDIDGGEDISLAQRRSRRQNRQLPLRYRDVLPQPPPTVPSESQYHPYPNRSSFQLGNWYWNQGIQKSQSDYAKLLGILGDNTFNAADVMSTHWKKINCQLGANEYDAGDGDEWEDEDAGWKCTPAF
ncbi:hypothetical protein DFH29DRAFT_999850 [Suillus ampliporus]|nr:hypothetical protein DFH29DRAFT_999850 [Suillus ampliporus]